MRPKQVTPLTPGDVFSDHSSGQHTSLTGLKVVPPFVRMTLQTSSETSPQKVYLEGKIYGDWKAMLGSRKEAMVLDSQVKSVLPLGREAEDCWFVRLNAEAGVYLLCYHGGRRKIDGFLFRENFKREGELHLRTEPQGKHGFCYRVFETL